MFFHVNSIKYKGLDLKRRMVQLRVYYAIFDRVDVKTPKVAEFLLDFVSFTRLDLY